MWSKQNAGTETPVSATATPTPASSASTPTHSLGASSTNFGSAGFGAASTPRSASVDSGASARLGPTFQIKGQITGSEDLQLDGTVEGPISLNGHELTVGPTAKLTSEIHAGEIVVYGKVVGNVHSKGRVDIKKDGSVTGDVDSARISIEDGAYFKGSIEIDPAKARGKSL
jgi:cytoskeletal protein CcmA (bactofilin family)